MKPEELLVGGVAIILGAIGVAISIGNWEPCYRMSKIRWIESIGGRAAARWAYAIGGLILITLGLTIAMGLRPHASRPPTARSHNSPTRAAVRVLVPTQCVGTHA